MKLTSLYRPILLTTALASSFFSMANESPARIISAGSTVTELLFALGAKESVVAVDLTSRHYLPKDGVDTLAGNDPLAKQSAAQSNLTIPVLGYHRQLAAEGLLALSPTHLIGSPDMAPDTTLNLLRSAGVEVTMLPSGNTVSDFEKRVDALANLTGKQQEGAQIKASVTTQMQALAENTPIKKPKVLFVMMSDGRPITVAGDQTTVSTVIELAGGINPAAKHTTSYKPLSVESIVEMQPDFILVSDRTLDQNEGFDGVLKQHPLLAATPAVKNGRVIAISGYAIVGGFGLASLELAHSLNDQFNVVN
ncbi:ABC transporter substrate-binding protein [Vibrio sp. SM6]|uniref:ABC transporter substrate-binding protein n=1 Tax=Vibrio agarilyticus TaxID=2726741 RepID=A0A7X8TQZ7_9VIBR|nr:ABC transporter substrate-binding protein [Vibrio agarilyticus]NLS13377.1 ABC transporter substrate-binding protein [Vibrio agarilyticus]